MENIELNQHYVATYRPALCDRSSMVEAHMHNYQIEVVAVAEDERGTIFHSTQFPQLGKIRLDDLVDIRLASR